MNTSLALASFPSAITLSPSGHEELFRGVAIPAGLRAAEAFYRGLPCVGWAVREACQQKPEANQDQLIELCLRALRDQVMEGSTVGPQELELAVLAHIQKVLSAVYSDLQWRAPEPAAPIHAVPQAEIAGGERRPLILVADDCPISRFVITNELRKAGMDSLAVADGADALLMAPIFWPDLILMDVQMEYLSGVQTCSFLKPSQLVGHPPVIFLSGNSEKDAIVQGFQAGGADYITKPFEPREGLSRIHAHLQIRQLQVQLETSNQQLRRANVAKDRILSVTSHDLRGPLSAIRGMAEFLKDGSLGPINEKQTETLQYLSGSVEGMLSLVNDLLDVTTLDEGTVKLDRAPMDLGPVLQWVNWIFTQTAARKNIKLKLDVPAGGLRLDGDEARLKRVLENLVTNAIKFSPAHTTVTLGASQKDGLINVWVDDEGSGVPVEEQFKLFAEYGRTSVRPTGGESSTGLGLAICRRIVSGHGGAIVMRNRPTGGAHFEFCLPAAARQPATEAQVA